MVFCNSTEIITLNNHNHISLLGTIDKQLIDTTITTMNNIKTNEFYLYINSPGGYVEDGERLISNMMYLQNTGKTINCIAENAHSMAFNIFQNCDTRYITSSSKVMQHQVQLYEVNGPLDNVYNYIKMIKTISDRLHLFCSKRIGMELNEYIRKINTDWWLTGEEIISNNVADKVAIVGCDNTDSVIGGETLLLKKSNKCPLIYHETK